MKVWVACLIVAVCVYDVHAQNWVQKKFGATTKEEREAYREAKSNEADAKREFKDASKDRQTICSGQGGKPVEISDAARARLREVGFGGVGSTCDAAKDREAQKSRELDKARADREAKEKEYRDAKKRDGAIF